MSKNHKKVCRTLDYIEHFLILAYGVIGYISISAFVCLVGISIGITSSTIGLKFFAIVVGIKKYRSIIKKKKDNDKVVLLAKSKLNTIEVLISKALFDSNVSYDEFVLINNVVKENNDMKEEIKNLTT